MYYQGDTLEMRCLDEMLKKIFSTSILLALFSFVPSPAKASLDLTDGTESLIEVVLEGASNTIGKKAKAKDVQWDWCDDTYYDSRSNLICLEKEFIGQLSKIGDAAVAFVIAHEYAHHVQFAQSQLIAKAQNNTMRLELQADCFAGVILANLPNISFDQSDVESMITAAALLGDKEYDHYNHHGAGENRALALRSGLRFGASKGQTKDAYYKMFCLAR